MAVETRVLAAVEVAYKDVANALAAQLDPFGAGHLTFRDWYASPDGTEPATHVLAETTATSAEVRDGIAATDAGYDWVRVVWYAERLASTPYHVRTAAALALLGLEPLPTEDDLL